MKKRINRALAALLALVMAMTLAPAAGASGAVAARCPVCGQSGYCTMTVVKAANCHETGVERYVCTRSGCNSLGQAQLIETPVNKANHDYIFTDNQDGTHSGMCRYDGANVGPEAHTGFYNANGVCEKCGAFNYSQVGMSLPERRTVPISLGDASAKLSAGDIKLTLGSADITSEYTVNCLWFYQGVQVASGSEYPLPASVYNKEGVYYYDLVVSAVPKGTLHRQTVTETCNITVQVEELVTAGAVVTTLDADLRLGDGDGWSAEPVSSQIYAQVLAVCGREAAPSHIRFNELPSGDVGKLSVTSTSTNYYFRGAESLLDNVAFQPGKTAGEFMASFTAFDTAGKSYAGVLTITVQQYAGDMDVVYATPRNTTLLLETADFQDFWERVSPGGTLDYITFETDSIIPLDFYSLKNTAEQNYTSRTRRRTIHIHRSVYTTNPFLGMDKVYNRYYLVKLPDGNYVLSYLDDAYYVKYRLAGKVQLPLGRVVQMMANEREYAETHLSEYGLDEELILDMFAEERYEQQDFLNTLVPFAVATVTAGLLLALLVVVEKVAAR